MSITEQTPVGHQARVAQAVERIWPGAEWDAEPIEDGMTNRNSKVTVRVAGQGPQVVVVQERLPEHLAAAVGICRSNQMRLWPAMTDLGLAPTLLGAFDDLGVTVVEFVQGTRVAEFEDRMLAIRLGAEALQALHTATRGDDTPGLCSDPFEGVTWFEARVREESPHMLEEFQWALDLTDRIRAVRGPYVPCQSHSDPSQVNMFVSPDSDRLVLIDWEYVGAGDGYIDLGHFAARYAMSPDEEIALARAYEAAGGEPVTDEALAVTVALVRVNRYIAMLREGMWSALAAGIGFLDFDHASYARHSLALMAATAQRDDFKAAIETLRRGTPGP